MAIGTQVSPRPVAAEDSNVLARKAEMGWTSRDVTLPLDASAGGEKTHRKEKGEGVKWHQGKMAEWVQEGRRGTKSVGRSNKQRPCSPRSVYLFWENTEEVTGSSQTKLLPFILPAQTAVIRENCQKGSDRIACLVTKLTNQSINEAKSNQRGGRWLFFLRVVVLVIWVLTEIQSVLRSFNSSRMNFVFLLSYRCLVLMSYISSPWCPSFAPSSEFSRPSGLCGTRNGGRFIGAEVQLHFDSVILSHRQIVSQNCPIVWRDR